MAVHYSQVVKKLIQPADKMSSVIDTFDVLGQILERVQKIRDGEYVSESDIQYVVVHSLFALGFFPFWQAHGGVLRPILLKVLSEKGNVVENFFIDAIPMALTTAMPNRQLEYTDMRESVKKAFRE